MDSNELYDKLQSFFPDDLQFVNPYLSDVPVPTGSYAQMNILDVENVGWVQTTQNAFNEETGLVENANRIQRKYTVQFDFYNENAQENALNLNLSFLTKKQKQRGGQVSLGFIGKIQNRSFLQENKTYKERYGFDIQFFIVDTYINNNSVVESVNLKWVNHKKGVIE